VSQRERPILFSAPLVRAILAGTKTVTRRPIKPQPVGPVANVDAPPDRQVFAWHPTKPVVDGKVMPVGTHRFRLDPASQSLLVAQGCRYGQPGDRLYVRESCWLLAVEDEREPRLEFGRHIDGEPFDSIIGPDADLTDADPPRVWFAADGELPKLDEPWRWLRRNSIHMPRWASRIVLEVTGVTIERLQDITEEDAKAEGVEPIAGAGGAVYPGTGAYRRPGTHRDAFRVKWIEIYGAESWDLNGFVWRVAFKRIEVA